MGRLRVCLLVFLSLVLCFSIAACKKTEKKTEPTAVPATATPEATAQPTLQLPTIAPATQEPVKKLTGVKICIDAAHQAIGDPQKEACAPWEASANSAVNNTTMVAKCTSGATGKFSGTAEYKLNLEIAIKLKAALEQLGATILMTRESADVNLSNQERAMLANNFKSDITLTIHCNGAENQDAAGIEIYVRGKGDYSTDYATKSKTEAAIANTLLSCLINATQSASRGVKTSDAFTEINWNQGTCLHIECGFLSNETEDTLLNDPYYHDMIVNGFVDYFLHYYGA